MDDLAHRIRAARAHAGISRETLADGIALTHAQLERLEVGLDEPVQDRKADVIRELAQATRPPESFFTGDYSRLA